MGDNYWYHLRNTEKITTTADSFYFYGEEYIAEHKMNQDRKAILTQYESLNDSGEVNLVANNEKENVRSVKIENCREVAHPKANGKRSLMICETKPSFVSRYHQISFWADEFENAVSNLENH